MEDKRGSVGANTVLVVDDNRANLHLLTRVLSRRGYAVRASPGGRLALNSVRSHLPDLILLDVMMPDLDGYEVCTMLKADERTRDIPVIFISAAAEVFDKVKAFSVGGVDYITKPFQVEEVLVRVKTHLAIRNLQENLKQKNAQLEQEIVDRERIEEVLQRRNQELGLLNRLGQELTATLDLQLVTKRLLRAVTEIIGAKGASVWLWEEDRVESEGNDDAKRHLTCWAVIHRGEERPPTNLSVESGQGVVGWVAQTGKGVIVDNVHDDNRFFSGIDEQTGFSTQSMLAVPLRTRGTIVGVLEAVNKLEGAFDDDDLALVETLAASAAIAADNARLVDTLRQRTVELDAFAHTVAHDLKNPLSQVIGYADLLREEYDSLSDQEMYSWSDKISRNGRRIDSIIDELLLFASMRKVDVVRVPLNMAELVAGALDRLERSVKESQVHIIMPDEWPDALGYGPWVENVWANYISNGIKYGGSPPRLELGAHVQPEGLVCFWVHDNGPGIPPEDQERLFTPFTRLDQVRAKGHGLGLSIVQRIVDKLGGQVGMESRMGEGSRVWFTLPASDV